MTLQAPIWHHDGLQFHTVLMEATDHGMAGTHVDARGYATWMDDQNATDILSGLNQSR